MIVLLFALIVFVVSITIFVLSQRYKQFKLPKKENVIKQISPMKIIVKTIAVIMLVFGFSLTNNMPKKLYGLSYKELGALANGYAIENVETMLDFMDMSDVKDLDELDLSNNRYKAEGAIKESISYTCIYWFVCATLLFVHIKDKEIQINTEVKEESKDKT